MGATNEILASRKESIWHRFRLLRLKPVPPLSQLRALPEALRMAYLKGLQDGYGEGLVDGVDLGLDVGVGLAMTPALTSGSPIDLS